MNIKKLLTIAGSDSSGGAGIQADIKTFSAHKVYGMSVITAVTAQNTTGVKSVCELPVEIIRDQLESVFTDMPPDAIKTGMLSNPEIIECISKGLLRHKGSNLVVDPVMVSTSGHRLLSEDALSALKDHLFPLARVITPNIYEAEILSGGKISNKKDMVDAAMEISNKLDGWVVIKGGHLKECCDDLLYSKNEKLWLKARKINNKNTHGTGCTLSSAIASNLALGMGVKESVFKAKRYVNSAIREGLDLGEGRGPLLHHF
jgi:hydroxymethylpyrimidine/phosphomethylpyrimidine kinase